MSDRSFQLVVRKGPKPGQVFTLSSSSITIGRDPMSDISLSDPEVSRYHAQLVKTETGYQIQDMGSTNGTFIEGEKLGSDPVDLIPGKAIQFGSGVILDYKITGVDEAAMATVIDTSQEALAAARQESAESTQAEEPKDIPSLPDLEESPATPAYTAPPVSESPPKPPTTPPLVATSEDGGKRRRSTIIAVIVLLLLCCCCAFVVSGYYVWGDPLLDWLRDFLAQQGLNISGLLS